MRITLYINSKKIQFWVNAGWYKGEPFALFKVSLLESYYGDPDSNSWTIFDVQIARLMFAVGFEALEVK